jgi:hypothetical protein
MFKMLLPAVATLGLVAFAAESGAGAPPQDTTVSTPAMGWSVHHEGALAKLAYGVANSDQLALMVTCMPGDTTAVVYGDVQPDGARMTRASLEIDPLSGGEAEEMRVPVGHPGLANLAARGRMTVVGEAGRFELGATTKERRLVADFLAYCAPGRA